MGTDLWAELVDAVWKTRQSGKRADPPVSTDTTTSRLCLSQRKNHRTTTARPWNASQHAVPLRTRHLRLSETAPAASSMMAVPCSWANTNAS